MKIEDYLTASKAVKKIAPDLPDIKRVYLAKHISDLYMYGRTRLALDQITAVINFMKISNDITDKQRNELLFLVSEAENERDH